MEYIYKYPLAWSISIQEIEMSKGAIILCVQAQDNIPHIWAMISTRDAAGNKPIRIKRRFRTYATGEEMKDAADFTHYVGTYQLGNGALVYHVFTDQIER